MTKTKLIAGAVAVTVAAAFAGCSTAEDKNNYVDEVNTIQQDVSDASLANSATVPDSKSEFADALQKEADNLNAAIKQLNDVDVPEEAQEGHDALVTAVQSLADLYEKTAKEIENASTSELISIGTALTADETKVTQQIDAAIDQINQDIGAE